MERKVWMVAFALCMVISGGHPRNAKAWGDEGHEIVALISQSYLEPDVRQKVAALLAADPDSLTTHDIPVSERSRGN